MSRSGDEVNTLRARQGDEPGGLPRKTSAELLRRGLVLGDGFALYVVAAEQLDTREALLLEDAAIDRPIEAAQRKLAAGNRRPVVVVTGLEELDEAPPRPRQLDEEIAAKGGHAAALAREVLATASSPH